VCVGVYVERVFTGSTAGGRLARLKGNGEVQEKVELCGNSVGRNREEEVRGEVYVERVFTGSTAGGRLARLQGNGEVRERMELCGNSVGRNREEEVRGEDKNRR